MDHFRNITIRFAKTRHYLHLVVCVLGNVQYLESYRALSAFIASFSRLSVIYIRGFHVTQVGLIITQVKK